MELTAALFDLCKSSAHPIIAIDGPAGAGKTTLADHLAAALSLKFKVAIIHMDDLYNGWDRPFDHHLTDALTHIASAHQAGERISVSRFNWSKSEYGPAEDLPQADLLILEGVGSSHSAIRTSLTASIWLEINRSLGLARVLERDGAGNSHEMVQWLHLQEAYFTEDGSESAADFILSTS